MMSDKQWKRLLALLPVLALAIVAFSACSILEGPASSKGDTIRDEGAVPEQGEAVSPDGDESVGNDSFELLDANANGVLEEREFNLLLAREHLPYEGQFDAFDDNADHHLTRDEYSAFLEDHNLSHADTIEGGSRAAGMTGDNGAGGSGLQINVIIPSIISGRVSAIHVSSHRLLHFKRGKLHAFLSLTRSTDSDWSNKEVTMAWKASGKTDLSLSEDEREWDGDEAEDAIFEWAGWPDNEDPDKAKQGFSPTKMMRQRRKKATSCLSRPSSTAS